MYLYIYIMFLVFVFLYSIYINFLMHRKDKVVPYPFKMRENPLLFLLDILIIILLVLGVYFLITDAEFPILLIMYYIFVPIFALQTIILNYLLYKKTKNKKIIFKIIMYIILVIISLLVVLNASNRYGISIKHIL